MTEEYIINSRLDTDWYKFTMGQFVFHRYPDIPVKYEFINRTKSVSMTEYVDEKDIRRELDHIMELKVSTEEMDFLASHKNNEGRPILKDDFLKFFENHDLPLYKLENIGHTYRLEFPGPWKTAIWWEIPALAIINELYTRKQMKKMDWMDKAVNFESGKLKLVLKIAKLYKHRGVRFNDFGTRRRFSRIWHEIIVKSIKRWLPEQFIGTSNVWLARKCDLKPIGTMAHELFMAMYGIEYSNENPIIASQKKVMREWQMEYGPDLLTTLTDTFGTDCFLQNMTKEQILSWKGLRQDSGNPFVFGEEAIKFYQAHGVDPAEKIIIFSDGLDAETMIALYSKFSQQINCVFGWRTNLTNDLSVKPLSLVIKLTEANGNPTVKLSDNIAKAVGEPAEIERAKKLIGYKNEFNQQPIY